MNIKCRVILTEDKYVGQWVARGLDYHICAQGDSVESAMKNFCELIYLEYKLSEYLHQKFEERISKAPQYIWDIFEEKYKNIPSTALPDFPSEENIPKINLTPRLAMA